MRVCRTYFLSFGACDATYLKFLPHKEISIQPVHSLTIPRTHQMEEAPSTVLLASNEAENCDTLWYALLSWPSCSSISELHCSVARLPGSRSILNWSLTPPFQSTLILFGKIVQSRASRMAAADHAVRCETLILFTKSMFSSSPEYLVWGCLPILTSVKEFIMTPGCASWKLSERKECDRWTWQSRFQISLPQNQDMDELDIEGRRSIVRRKYAELRADHPELPEVLRDFQVRGACLIVVKELIEC